MHPVRGTGDHRELGIGEIALHRGFVFRVGDVVGVLAFQEESLKRCFLFFF